MHTIVGNCPKCGAPIYSPMMWHSIMPPPSIYGCTCYSQTTRVITTDSTEYQP
ncbi:MAG: hypothetical protein Q7O66_14980 [Dehalococcoidia bacterium]|nr:hypothetical protein [Dehalococcoidia bacterium]